MKSEQPPIEPLGAEFSPWEVAHLRSTGLLTLARLMRVDASELRARRESNDGSVNGLPIGWQIGVEVTERLYRRMCHATGVPRQSVFIFGAENCCDHAVLVNDVGDVQHRVVIPLLGAQVAEFLAAVAGGMELVVVTMRGQGVEGKATGNRHAAPVARHLQPLIRPAPSDAWDAVANAVAVTMRMTQPDALGERGAGLSRDDLLVSMCVPEDIADQAFVECGFEAFPGPLN